MSIAPTETSPRRAVDAQGRAIPMTEAEVRGRAGEVARALESLDAMGDEAEQRATLDGLLKALDSSGR